MRVSRYLFVLLMFSICGLAQEITPPPIPPPPPPPLNGIDAGAGPKIMIRHEMGEWWKNSDTVKKLQLSDGQIAQLDQAFYDHRLKLIDYGAQMEKEDLKLQNLLDADVPNEGQIEAQVDHVLAARGKLEREFTMMNLDLRKVLSLDQWRQLKTIRQEKAPGGNQMFFYKQLPDGTPPPGPGPGAVLEAPAPIGPSEDF